MTFYQQRLDQARHKLEIVQGELKNSPLDQSLFNHENEILTEMAKWSHIEEQVLQHRATWIECGDSNTKYFHAQWKTRTSKNHITSIYTESGINLTDPAQIVKEFISFFTKLMEESGEVHKCPDAAVVKQGRCLDQQQKVTLVKNVTNEEILAAIKDMLHDKAPRVDGFHIEFFTTQWTIVGSEIGSAPHSFSADRPKPSAAALP
ncbi:PREDICTED: uncharacterized protein LOC109244796 [Nicotiana attenuata]|uniref:uncharacterized protein LOC109244796 n=1 Tax=Nicotiana attenuata TaxID=49451 RepID=UPI000905CD52|nr:PREDICTED: uncharacterized protein LOC109244796 [Nicotiana attenuata]